MHQAHLVREQRKNELHMKHLQEKLDKIHRWDHFKENLGDAIRVLPGIGLVQGHLLQAFSRRGLNKTKRSAHLAESTAG